MIVPSPATTYPETMPANRYVPQKRASRLEQVTEAITKAAIEDSSTCAPPLKSTKTTNTSSTGKPTVTGMTTVASSPIPSCLTIFRRSIPNAPPAPLTNSTGQRIITSAATSRHILNITASTATHQMTRRCANTTYSAPRSSKCRVRSRPYAAM